MKIGLPTINRQILWMVLPATVILACLAVAGWYFYSLRPPMPPDTSAVNFTLPAGERVKTIASRLEEAGLVRSSRAFLVYITLHGVRSGLQAGSYSLSRSHSVADIDAILSQGKIRTNLLVIPEGTSMKQIVGLAGRKGIVRTEMEAALKASYDHRFLADRPRGASLEGYLFPDSYNVDGKISAKELVGTMLENFARKVPAKFRPLFAKKGFSLHEGLTLASIVEKEVASDSERPLVAQVLLKRLQLGMKLETDPSVDYAAELLGVRFNLSLDSPYNTYLYEGLPPGPISNPGLSALEAVVNPAKTDYLYFVTGKDGKTRFSADFSEHQRNIAKFGVSAR